MKKITIILLSILYVLNISAQRDSVDLGEITISANRNAQSIKKTAQQVAVLKAKDIQFLNPQTAGHALEQTGQVFVQRSQGGGGSPIIRGFEANKVLLVVDGVRMNNSIYRGGHLQNIITIDPNMLERAEVLFGSNSLMYGSDALGGVMYFQTRKPELATDGNLNINGNAMVRYSSAFDEKTANAVLNIGTKRIASLTSFTYSDFGDLRTGSNFNSKYGNWGKRSFYVERINNIDSIVKNNNVSVQKGTAYSQYDILEKILFQQNEHVKHGINIQFSNSSDIPRYDRLSELNSKGLPTQAEWYYGPQKRLLTSYNFELNKQTAISDRINIVAAYQDIEESRYTRSYGSNKRTDRVENVKVISLNADIQKEIGKQTLNYGIEIQNNDVNSTARSFNVKTNEVGTASTRYPDGGSAMTSMAAYLSVNRALNKAIDFFVGARYNYTSLKSNFIDKTFFPLPFNELKQQHGALVGNIGLVINKAGFTIAPSISSAYRAPNVDDAVKVFESAEGRLIVPNADLKPEQTVNFELKLGKSFGNVLNIQVIPFYTRLFNALSLSPTTFDGKDSILFLNQKSAVYSTQNLAKAEVIGLFAAVNGQIIDHLTYSASYTYTKGNVLTEGIKTPLDHIAPAFGRISLNYEKEKMQVSLYTLFNGEKKSRDYRLGTEDNELYSADTKNGFMPAWWTLNLRGSYTIKPYLTLQVGLENILDTHYRVFASGVSGAGRNFSITLRSKF